jgi:hypothetical protein
MTMSSKDRALGMDRKITRRDLLDGVALSAGLAMLFSFFVIAPCLLGGPQHPPS